MPIYEYSCPQCDNVFEEWVKSHEGAQEAPCPQCGTQAIQIISNTSFVLKGGGWYVTEYGNRKNQENNGDTEQDKTASQNKNSDVDGGKKAKSTDAKGSDSKANGAEKSSNNVKTKKVAADKKSTAAPKKESKNKVKTAV